MKGWALSLALLAGAWGTSRLPPAGVLPPYGHPPVAAFAAQDTAAAVSGERRVGGELAFIQLLQYFSTQDPASAGKPKSQWLPSFLPNSLRFVRLSPFFHSGFLYSAGCLGFVLDRPEEALSILEAGAALDPSFWRYRIYAAAIAYSRDANADKVTALLEEALKYPDCPSLLAHILANLHKKAGRYQRAADIYRHLMETSRDLDAVHRARVELEALIDRGLAR